MDRFEILDKRIVWEEEGEILWLEPYGSNAIRFRSSKRNCIEDQNWNLLSQKENNGKIVMQEDGVWLYNGKICAFLRKDGAVSYYKNDGSLLLSEYYLDRRESMAPVRPARCYRALSSDVFKTSVYFKSNKKEHIYGMGQNQNDCFDLKGSVIELAQKNTQSTIPFYFSTIGYGFVWNNPGIGRVEFATNHLQWFAEATKQVDYLIFAGQNAAEILQYYYELYGPVPEIPDYATGFWQSKCRYETQKELLDVAREYKRRELPISVIVADFFHWTEQGDWKFDEKFWPDIEKMIVELREMGITLVVSIWPTVDPKSENYEPMRRKGYLIRAEKGVQAFFLYMGPETYFDATNPRARDFIWNTVKKNYYDKGVRSFWLDEAEPEIRPYDYDNLRYYLGNGLEVSNIYPYYYNKAFSDGIKNVSDDPYICLTRCAWLGSQRLGICLWTGDVGSNFEWLRKQVTTGLNVALSGIPYWTTDIGGFFDGNIEDPVFRELIVRWFQFAVFCPIFRLHGNRMPYIPRLHFVHSGGPNEIWSFGDEAYEIIRELLFMRERIRPYIREQCRLTTMRGTPIMRPLLYDFPEDLNVYTISDQYMFGSDIMVAPILEQGARSRYVYLPEGAAWKDTVSGRIYKGGIGIEYDAPISIIPVFLRDEANIPVYER